MYHAALSWKLIMAQGMRIIRGDDDTPHHHGDTSHFQALATAR